MDTRTLMITASTLGAALFVLMVVVYRTRRVYPGFGCWVVAVGLFAFGTSGFVLLPRSIASRPEVTTAMPPSTCSTASTAPVWLTTSSCARR